MPLAQSIGQQYRFGFPERPAAGISAGRGMGAPSGGGPDLSAYEAFDNLQQVEGLTEKFYQDWNAIKSFANTMWNNFGIDVTSPDVTRSEAVDAHMTFQKALANIQNLGNALQRGQEALAQAQKEGQFYVGSQPISQTVADPTMFGPVDITEGAKEFGSIFDQGFETDQERQVAQSQIDGALSDYESALSNPNLTPQQRQQLQVDYSYLKNLKARHAPKIFAPQGGGSGASEDADLGAFFTRWSNILMGSDKSYRASNKPNVAVLEGPDIRGTRLGGSEIRRIEHNTETGTTTFITEDGEETSFDSMEDPDLLFLMENLSSSNTRFPTVEKIREAMKRHVNAQGRVPVSRFLDEDFTERYEQTATSVRQRTPAILAKESEIRQLLDDWDNTSGLVKLFQSNPRIKIGDRELRIEESDTDGLFTISNLKDIISGSTMKPADMQAILRANKSGLTKEEIISISRDLGLFDDIEADEQPRPAQQSTPPASGTNNADDDADYLINKAFERATKP